MSPAKIKKPLILIALLAGAAAPRPLEPARPDGVFRADLSECYGSALSYLREHPGCASLAVGVDKRLSSSFEGGIRLPRGLRLEKTLEAGEGWDNDLYRISLNGSNPILLKEAMKGLSKMGEVSYFEPDYEGEAYVSSWDIPAEANDDYWTEQISLDDAWELSTGRSTNLVGVIDTGIDSNHFDLSGNVNTSLSTSEFTESGISGDYNGDHGTGVAGIIGGKGNNGFGGAGVNWRVSLVSIRADGPSNNDWNEPYHETPTSIANALSYAQSHGIDIVNYSGGFPTCNADPHPYVAQNAINNFSGLLVVASGNSPWNIDDGDHKVYPASYSNDNLLVVGASTKDDVPNMNCCWGQVSVDLFAPGTGIYVPIPGSSTYIQKNGTSLSAPFVTGVAALMRSVNPGLTVAQLKSIIMANVDVDDSSLYSGKCVTGGRLNAYKAVKAALPTHAVTEASFSSPSVLNSTYPHHWYRLTVPGPTSVTISPSNYGNLSLDAELYADPLSSTPLATSAGVGGGFPLSYSFSSAGSYYLKVHHSPYQIGNASYTLNLTHTHVYTDHYVWWTKSKHHSYCGCGSFAIEAHVVSLGGTTCLRCGGTTSGGIIGPLVYQWAPLIGADSRVLPDGTIVLGPIDYQSYLGGTLDLNLLYMQAGGLL